MQGRTAIVTGGTRGIGRATAAALVRAGARVAVSGRNEAGCQEAARALRAEGGEVLGIACDIRRPEQVEALASRTEQAWGATDMLVLNAAVNPYYGPSAGITDAAFDQTMGANLRSALQLANRVAPGMAAAGGGSIVLVSSLTALFGSESLGLYSLTKAAECQLARNLAVEWGPRGVRVNAVAPGLVRTAFARALWEDEERLRRITMRTPLRRIAEPEDIAGVVLFLLSDASRFVTGQVIVADGGAAVADPL